jgi:hypothetical protein
MGRMEGVKGSFMVGDLEGSGDPARETGRKTGRDALSHLMAPKPLPAFLPSSPASFKGEL